VGVVREPVSRGFGLESERGQDRSESVVEVVAQTSAFLLTCGHGELSGPTQVTSEDLAVHRDGGLGGQHLEPALLSSGTWPGDQEQRADAGPAMA